MMNSSIIKYCLFAGYFVCPGCCTEGPWENFVVGLKEKEKYLTPFDIEEILSNHLVIDKKKDANIIPMIPYVSYEMIQILILFICSLFYRMSPLKN